MPITGLGANTTVVGLDCAATKLMSIVTVVNNVLHQDNINPDTGEVITLGGAGITLSAGTTTFAADGEPFDYSFPGVSVMTNLGELFRIYPNSAASGGTFTYAAGDPHAGATPAISGLAYNNNFVGAKANVLYGIDSYQAALVVLDRTNRKLKTIGSLGFITNQRTGFDISGVSGIAYAALSAVGTGTKLYTVDLTTGTATEKGNIGPASPPATAAVIATT